jgi:hypothetical protein
MLIRIKLKFWLFENYWWLLCVVIAIVAAVLVTLKESVSTVVSVGGTLLSIIYFLQKQKIEELRVFMELFKEFNERYDRLNEQLDAILKSEKTELSSEEKNILIDYFNLCGEEYLYFRKGYIDPVIWAAWENGMKSIFSNSKVRFFWENEKKTESYYGLSV